MDKEAIGKWIKTIFPTDPEMGNRYAEALIAGFVDSDTMDTLTAEDLSTDFNIDIKHRRYVFAHWRKRGQGKQTRTGVDEMSKLRWEKAHSVWEKEIEADLRDGRRNEEPVTHGGSSLNFGFVLNMAEQVYGHTELKFSGDRYFHVPNHLTNEGAKFLGVAVENTLYLAARGTQTLLDACADIACTQAEYAACGEHQEGVVKVHAGFQIALGSVKAELLKTLQGYKGYDIVITGHSLGGALSTLLAVELCAMELFQKISLVTWGAPPVGNIAFANLFRSYTGCTRMESHRFFVPSDPVPHLLCWNPYYSHATPGKPLGGPLATIVRVIGSATGAVSIVYHLGTHLNQKKNQFDFEKCGEDIFHLLSSHQTFTYQKYLHADPSIEEFVEGAQKIAAFVLAMTADTKPKPGTATSELVAFVKKRTNNILDLFLDSSPKLPQPAPCSLGAMLQVVDPAINMVGHAGTWLALHRLSSKMDRVEQQNSNIEQRTCALHSSIKILADNLDTGLKDLQESIQKEQRELQQNIAENEHILRVSRLRGLMSAFKSATNTSSFYEINSAEIHTLHELYLDLALRALSREDHNSAKLNLRGRDCTRSPESQN
jgi:hypothetical protein